MYKKAMLLSLLGFAAGCLIGLAFHLQDENFSLSEALPNILLGGIPGAIAMGTTVVYDIEKWSLFRATATHFLIAIGVILLGCFVLHWFKPWSRAFWLLLAFELAAYVIIWLFFYFSYRKKIRQMNEELKKYKSAQHE